MDEKIMYLVSDIEEALNKIPKDRLLVAGRGKSAKGDMVNARMDCRLDYGDSNYNYDCGPSEK